MSSHRGRLATLTLASLMVLTAPPVARAQPQPTEKATLRLAAERTAFAPGSEGRLAAVVTIEPGWHVNSQQPTYDWLIPTELQVELPSGWPASTVDYPPGEMKRFAFADEPLSVYDGVVVLLATLRLPVGLATGEAPVSASLRYQACDDRQCLPPVTTTASLTLRIGGGGEPSGDPAFESTTAATARSGRPAAPGLVLMLVLAVVGGLILNAMPCVLPVLSIKVFGLVKTAGEARSSVVAAALATAIGILASFWVLALAAVLARAAGGAVGWGIQFQRPGFVAFLAVVVILFCLNLWGLFEIRLPASLARVGGAGARAGLPGHLASGLFATLMATPCSAPFLGTAVGFALAQEAGTIFSIFTAIGLGMALPYLTLAVAPGAARLLPRPGPWMENLRVLMGFLLAGAVVWLFYVLSAQISPVRLAAVQLALLLLALFVWIRHRLSDNRRGRPLAALGIAAAAALALALAASAEPAGASPALGAKRLISWQPFDRERAENLAAGGRLVFIDVTADWCFTCKVNERLVLETPEIAGAFERYEVVAMKADWTQRDDAITDYLASFGRYGIPFYLLYRPGADPHLFSELLSKREVITTLEEAATGTAETRVSERFE